MALLRKVFLLKDSNSLRSAKRYQANNCFKQVACLTDRQVRVLVSPPTGRQFCGIF